MRFAIRVLLPDRLGSPASANLRGDTCAVASQNPVEVASEPLEIDSSALLLPRTCLVWLSAIMFLSEILPRGLPVFGEIKHR